MPDIEVTQEVYESAVRGRQDFRKAYRDLLPIQRAAQAISDAWRSPVDIDTLYELVNELDIAVTGGGPTTPEMKQAIAARYTPRTTSSVVLVKAMQSATADENARWLALLASDEAHRLMCSYPGDDVVGFEAEMKHKLLAIAAMATAPVEMAGYAEMKGEG